MKKLLALGIAAVALLALTPLASGHAVVSLLQPQGKALTSASVLYVLRVPNERAKQDTIQVSLTVPPDVQGSISVKSTGDWTTILKRHDTGVKNADGDPVLATDKITWIAKPESRIKPGFFGEFYFRLRNPAVPEKLCFSVDQWYTKKEGAAKPELVSWSGPSTAATPASCIDVVAS